MDAPHRDQLGASASPSILPVVTGPLGVGKSAFLRSSQGLTMAVYALLGVVLLTGLILECQPLNQADIPVTPSAQPAAAPVVSPDAPHIIAKSANLLTLSLAFFLPSYLSLIPGLVLGSDPPPFSYLGFMPGMNVVKRGKGHFTRKLRR